MHPLHLIDTDKPLQQIKEMLAFLENIKHEAGKARSAKIELDLSRIEWILPCASLLLSHRISELRSEGCKVDITAPRSQAVVNHLKQIGFPFGNEDRPHTCFPICHFRNNVPQHLNEMFRFIDQNFPKVENYQNGLKYVLSELADNLEQHSAFGHATVMAQCFEKKGYIDIGIMDNGITIPGRFEKSGITFNEDFEAVNLALNGKSTKAQEEGRGWGLPTTSELMSKGFKGSLLIISRRGAVDISTSGARNLYKLKDESLSGTLVYGRFGIPRQKVDITPYTS